MEKIKILIADDQAIVAEGIGSLLSIIEAFEVVKIVENGKQVLDVLNEIDVDIILMDIRMPIMNGVECTRRVKDIYPHIKVLILTTFDDDEYIREAMQNGAAGYMLKDLSAETLSLAIKNVYHGSNVIHPNIVQKIFSENVDMKVSRKELRTIDGQVLTSREQDVLKLIAKGLTNPEIAEELFLSVGTVKNYITLLYDKLGIKGRIRLMTYAIDSGILDEE